MSSSELPERASLAYLKKLAKDRLQALRRTDPRTQLAVALLAVARDHGFPSWRALKAEVDRRQTSSLARFFAACAAGDVATLRPLLAQDPGLVHVGDPTRPHGAWTGLHTASEQGHLDAVRLLLKHGANPNAREHGDNTYPLHFAGAKGHLEIVRALLDAGGDVHGVGDLHELDAIGWCTYFRPSEDTTWDVARLLIERGARHHIFSALSIGDLDLVQQLVEQSPESLDRRMSRFEHRQTPLHFAIGRRRYDLLDLLIALGADLEAEDGYGQTALGSAMLRGDNQAMRRLQAAGATAPATVAATGFTTRMTALAGSIEKTVSMIRVPDIAATLAWYTSIGFTELGRYEDDGVANFGMLAFGKAELMLSVGTPADRHDVSLWFYTNRVDELYQLLKARQLEAALAGEPAGHDGITFEEELYEPFYGGRQFGIRDVNGYEVYFMQPSAPRGEPAA